MRDLARLIRADPDEPVRFTECLALGAWRRLNAGERDFSPEMWGLIEQLIAKGRAAEPDYAGEAVRELKLEDGLELAERMMLLHVLLATGGFRYRDDMQNIHALLGSEGMLGMLEYGRSRFVGEPVLGLIDTALR
jgi:hypothetical protein